MLSTFVLLNFYGMTVACMPCLNKLCTVAMSLSRDDDTEILYTFNDTEGMYIYCISLFMHITELSDLPNFLLLIKKNTYSKLLVSLCVYV